MPSLQALVGGFKTYKATTYTQHKNLITHFLQQGRKPTTLFITCCDLRTSPESITSCSLGDLYTVRTIAGLVPPFEDVGAHGAVAAVQYAVETLKIENIVVMGHAHCDGINSLMNYKEKGDGQYDAMASWLAVAKDAKNAVTTQLAGKSAEVQEKACEQESILISLRNLLTYPWVKEGVNSDSLSVYGWHFDIESGDLLCFNPATQVFEPLG